MKKRMSVLTMVVMMMVACSGVVFAEDGPFSDKNFSGTLSLTTDYVSRGISYTDGEPAVQGHFDYSHPSGLYSGIWASSLDDGGYSNNIELGPYVGFWGMLGPVVYDLMAAYYFYPDAEDEGFEFDYFEYHGGLSYTIEGTPLEPKFGIGYTYSPEYTCEEGAYHYFNGTLDLKLPLNFVLEFEVGHANVQGDKVTGNGAGLNGGDGYEYTHWRAGLTTEVKGFGLNLSYHDTNEEKFFNDVMGQQAGEKLVFTLSRSF